MKKYMLILLFLVLVSLIIWCFAFKGVASVMEPKKISQSQNDYINVVNQNLILKESDSIQEIKIHQLQRELDFLKKELIPLNELKREIDSFKKIGGIDSV